MQKGTWDLEIIADGVSQAGGTSLTADEAIAVMDKRPDCSFTLWQRGPFSHADNEAAYAERLASASPIAPSRL
jgi:hypothetical protein